MTSIAPVELHAPPRARPVPPGLEPGLCPGRGPAAVRVRAEATPFDEGHGSGAHASEHDRLLARSLDALDLRELSDRVARDARERGIRFGAADEPQEFRIDPSRG